MRGGVVVERSDEPVCALVVRPVEGADESREFVGDDETLCVGLDERVVIVLNARKVNNQGLLGEVIVK